MSLGDSLAIALRTLSANKLRSALTMLGILIGVAAVISLMSLGRGYQVTVVSSFQSLGTNLLTVRPGAPSQFGMRATFGTGATLTLEDAYAIAESPLCSSVSLVAPQDQGYAQVSASRENIRTSIIGTTPEYQYVRNSNLAAGEFISQQDLNRGAKVAVLGSRIAETLFGSTNPVGQSARIEGRRFEIIGVLKSKGSMFGLEDDMVIVPLSTLQLKLSTQSTGSAGGIGRTIRAINVQAKNGNEIDTAAEQIAAVLRQRHHIRPGAEDDFNIIKMEQVSQTMEQLTKVQTIFLGAVAGISLLVGGIGIMNIMLVSVTERTREIGIRKAIGARRRDILNQFLVEAATLSLLGGGMGIGLGWGIAQFISKISLGGYPLQAIVSTDIILLAVSIAMFIGLASGIYPAMRAARLDPIVALHYE